MTARTRFGTGLANFLLRPFHTAAPPRQVVGVVEACRVALGLLLMHQAADVIGFLELGWPGPASTASIASRAGVNLALGACLTVGFLTPLTLLALVAQLALRSITASLGDQVTVLTLWGLLFFGAGRRASADALLARLLPAPMRWLYALAVDPGSSRGLAWARFAVVLLFWGVCVVAMAFHFHDRFWWSGQVLVVAMTGSYFSSQHELFQSLMDLSPRGFHLFCALGLFVQVVWELFLLPLWYCRPGRWFVLVQGVGFFVVSAVCLNLQYLPLVEMVLWALLFGTGWRLTPAASTEAAGSPAPVRTFALAGALAVVVHLGLCPHLPAPIGEQRRARWNVRLHPFYRVLAQNRVDVFNRDDMNTNTCWLVLHETDPLGRHLRVVPYLDVHGGRLAYLRNDFLYFCNSLGWHRAAMPARFVAGDPAGTPSPGTQDFVRRLARLDALLTGGDGPRYYRVEVFHRELDEEASPPRWRQPRHVNGWAVALEPEDLEGRRWPAFDLPPGHWGERRRLEETHRWLAGQPPPGRPVAARLRSGR